MSVRVKKLGEAPMIDSHHPGVLSPRHPWFTCDSDGSKELLIAGEASSARMFGSKLIMDITDAGLIIFLAACVNGEQARQRFHIASDVNWLPS
jgi:hypothetical protein